MTLWKRYGSILAATGVLVLSGAEPMRVKQYEMDVRFSRADEMKIRSNRLANWYVLGEEAFFSSATQLPADAKVRVLLTDAEGSVYQDKIISGKEFNEDGWRWKTDEPGYYEVKFEVAGKGAIGESWVCPIWRKDPKRNRYLEVGRENFRRDVHAIAVTPTTARQPADIPVPFSLCEGLSEKSLRFASLVGFHGLRFHVVDWEKLEPEKGKPDWSSLDNAMALARTYGFKDNSVIFNVFGVPRWASSQPDNNQLQLGSLHGYKTVIPRDLKDWQNFLLALHKRYPDVRTYELWNEPHFPGYSVFWNDTPENHLKLIAAGYEALKTADPQITIWWAGLSARYLEFYKKFLSLGGGKYFDVLSLHGTWQDNVSFDRIEKENGLEIKPKVNSEWHANMIKPFQAYYPDEMQGSRKAMLGFFHMIRQGIRQIHMVSLFNEGGSELEELATNRKYGRDDPNVSGLFRVKPYTQPRYYAAAWRTLIDLYSGNIKVIDSWEWNQGENSCCALLTSSDAGNVLLFWGIGTGALEIPAELSSALKSARLFLPDGRPLAKLDRIQPDYYYIAKDPDLAVVEKWENHANVLKPYEIMRPLNQEVMGVYRPAPLFDAEMKLIDPVSMKFHKFRRELACDRNTQVGNTAAEFAAGLSEKGLDLLVRVKDKIHRARTTGIDFWRGDSVQFAIDTQNKGRQSDTVELGASWDEKGGAKLWKTISPLLDGDLPASYTSPNTPELKYGKVKFVRDGDVSEYRIHVEPTELYSFVYSKGTRLRIAMLVNNSDGCDRDSYLEWGSGIGNAKDSSLYGTLTVQLSDNAGFNQDDFIIDLSGGKYSRKDGVIRVETGDVRQAGVMTCAKPTPGGAEYLVEFDARGNVPVIMMTSGKGFLRMDPFGMEIPLSAGWKTYRASLSMPQEAESLSASIFTWEKYNKWFEIRNFNIVPR